MKNMQHSEIDKQKQQSDVQRYRWQKARITELLAGVAAGDANQARELASLVESHKRGWMALKLYRSKVPPLPFSAYLEMAWVMSHASVIRAAGSRAELARLFEYAQFDIPKTLPESITCWRGTTGVSVARARQGISWSLSRDVAAWFATARGSTQLLLKTTVPRSHILFYSDDRLEKEVVLARPPKIVVVDRDIDDWKLCADRYASECRVARTILLCQLKPVFDSVDAVAHSVD